MQAQRLQTNGAAAYVDDQCIWFEATPNFKSGTFWSPNQLDFTEDLDVIYRIDFGCADDIDGLAFVLQTTGAFAGNYTENLGVKGLAPSLVIEIDLYTNLEDSDPSFDHIAVMLDGSLDHASDEALLPPVALSDVSPVIDRCVNHWLRIEFDAKDKLMVVSFDCTEKLRFTISDDQISKLNLSHYGCTAGLGSSTAVIEVCPDFAERADTIRLNDYCPGDTITLASSSKGLAFEWRPVEAVFEPFKSVTKLIAPSEGVFTLSIIDDCGQKTEEIYILSTEAHYYQFSIDTVLCSGEEITIDLSDQPFANQMRWSTGESATTLSIQNEGAYFLLGQDDLCLYSDTIQIQEFNSLKDKLGTDQMACVGSQVTLGGSYLRHYDVQWQDGSMDPQMQATQTGSYGYSIAHRCGTHTEMINVVFENCTAMYMPSAFSPNGDGINDFFKPFAPSTNLEISKLSIFDRWGIEVFRMSDQTLVDWIGWDGRQNGINLPVATYLYMIEIKAPDLQRHSGTVHLIR